MTRLVEASSTFSGFYAAADPYSVRFRTPIGRKVPPSQNGQGHGHEDRIDLGLPRPASSGMVSKVTRLAIWLVSLPRRASRILARDRSADQSADAYVSCFSFDDII